MWSAACAFLNEGSALHFCRFRWEQSQPHSRFLPLCSCLLTASRAHTPKILRLPFVPQYEWTCGSPKQPLKRIRHLQKLSRNVRGEILCSQDTGLKGPLFNPEMNAVPPQAVGIPGIIVNSPEWRPVKAPESNCLNNCSQIENPTRPTTLKCLSVLMECGL